MNHPTPPLGRIITFYSYKGGVGRSFALADVAVLLASSGHRVLCVDWDLEAPGLSRYFHRWIPAGPHDGLLEAILAFRTASGEDAADRHIVVDHDKTGDRLHLLPSGRMDSTYVEAVQKLSWDDLYADGFGSWLEDLRNAWQWRYDFILIDARTGLSDTGGICTVELPHVVVLFTTPNHQSVEGTKQVIDAALTAHAALDRDRPALRVLPVATRIDDSEFERTEKWMTRMSETFAKYLSGWSAEADVDGDRAFRSLAVPYVPYWSYGEDLPVDRDHPGDPRSVLAAHRRLARELDPDAPVEVVEAPSPGLPSAEPLAAMISATQDLQEVAATVVAKLRARRVRVVSEQDVPIGARISDWLHHQLAASAAHFVLVGSGPLAAATQRAHAHATHAENPSTPINDYSLLLTMLNAPWRGLTVPLALPPFQADLSTEWLDDFRGVRVPGTVTDQATFIADFIETTLKNIQKTP